jgi:hypothetical protein
MKDSQGRRVILFHLKRFWKGQVGSWYIKDLDLYEEIRAGRKTSEWRDNTPYWRRRLISSLLKRPVDGTRAWFVVGYPKGNLPHLEATITEVLDDEDSEQLEIRLKDVVEVKA